jgi:dTDP-4-dehydrorhamnose reductase
MLLGAAGLFGRAFQLAAHADPAVTELLAPDRRELDVTSRIDVERSLLTARPDLVINAAVLLPADLCDTHPEAAYRLHALGARWVSRACAAIGATVVYLSTDFVFDGTATSPYLPDSPTRPTLSYGITKRAGEDETRIGCPDHLIVRTAGLFGPAPVSSRARPCFVHRVLERAAAGEPLTVVDSVVMSPTYTLDLARMTLALAAGRSTAGVYHVVNRGQASWYELCRAAVELAGYDVPVVAEQEQHHVANPRPARTPLAGELPPAVERLNRPWRDALRDYIERYWRGDTAGTNPADRRTALSGDRRH